MKKRQPRCLVEGSGFEGQFVATRSFNDRTPIASGTDPHLVRQDAKAKGAKSPVIVFVPPKNMVSASVFLRD
jgi:hypothetical protein